MAPRMTVGQAVKRRAVIIRPGDTVHRVARILSKNKVGSAVVVKGDEVVGIITDRDILDKVVARERDPKKVKVEDVMTGDPVTIEDDYDVQDAIERMTEKGIRRLLVTRLGKPIGFVTAADLLTALNTYGNEEEEETGEMEETEVYGICELCGQYGPLYRVYIEGGEKWVCESCKDSLNL
ncbi:inosine-5-monophosphate dehydrogenase [Thermococcus sp. P6]|uniref:CBS domain-containing protein n=1 Tax=Thermococcus sp. P6 TaxID=122420 RepID=UPI000B5A0937|nr:CBS domain-containing protein [Thermococcus sp. P6]ASJ11096.1 inosine-5-monophosphate dehydrogenase [Thermococcus sp. P6]